MDANPFRTRPARRLHSLLRAAGLAVALAAATPAGAQQPVTLRAGAFAPPGTVFATFWQNFKTEVERDSQGTIRVELSISEPNEANLLSNMRRNRLQCVGASLQGSATVLPEIAVLQLPYLFASFRQVDHVYDSALLDSYRKLFGARGVELLRFVEVGFTHTFSTQPVRSPADVRGVKMRATQARASQLWTRATGAEAVVMPIAEAVPGLQTGLVRGGESGLVLYASLLAKSAPHLTLTAHAFDSGTFLCNKAWFDGLTPPQQAVLRKASSTSELRAALRAGNEQFLAQAAARGVSVHQPTPAELAQWQAAGRKAADELLDGLGAEGRAIHARILQDLAQVR